MESASRHVLKERMNTTVAVTSALVGGWLLLATMAFAQPARLVEALEGDHATALAAAEQLASGGPPAAKALVEAWPALSPKARARACASLHTLAKGNGAAATELLTTAALDSDPYVRGRAVAALLDAGPRGIEALGSLAAIPEVGDQAAKALAGRVPKVAVAPLLSALGQPGGDARPELRRALRKAFDRAGLSGTSALDAWIDAGPAPGAAASCALALSGGSRGADAVRLDRLVSIARTSDEFATMWRAIQSIAPDSASGETQAWLERIASDAKPWMLRAAAIDALGQAASDETLARALADAYPRVRVAAAHALAGHDNALVPLAERARKDSWHLVRVAALQSLVDEQKALPIFLAAIDDPAAMVRAQAIDLLASNFPDADAWERIETRLSADTWPEVKAAAIRYAGTRCIDGAVDALTARALRAVQGGASVYDAELGAEAVASLGQIGSPSAHKTLQRLIALPATPQSLRVTAERALQAGPRCR